MRRKVLIVPDKFKGTLSADEAAKAIARGWRTVHRNDVLELLPMSDGGDGFGTVTSGILQARPRSVRTIDAAHRIRRAKWWWEPQSRTAIIEAANVVGLALLPAKQFHPFELDTFGLGAVMRAAARHGAMRCILGIGGSATNDGGFGLARAIGWEFLDQQGEAIGQWTDLHQLADIRMPKRKRWFRELIVAADVQNPLLGSKGATRVYGPQKGLGRQDFKPAERCLRRLATVVEKRFSRRLAHLPGAGAAGGLGFGLVAFANAKIERGFDLFSKLTGLKQRLRRADIVITGEGSLDASTLMGKGVGELARQCRRERVSCIALAGHTNGSAAVRAAFTEVHALTDMTSLREARRRPAYWLERLAARSAERCSAFQY